MIEKRIVLSWRLVNPMAPHVTQYIPTTLQGAEIMEVETTFYHNHASMAIWFLLSPDSQFDSSFFGRYLHKSQEAHNVYEAIGVKLDTNNQNMGYVVPVFTAGNTANLRLTFKAANGKEFIEVATQKFDSFVRSICADGYLERYSLPEPRLYYEPMVKNAYAQGCPAPLALLRWEGFQATRKHA